MGNIPGKVCEEKTAAPWSKWSNFEGITMSSGVSALVDGLLLLHQAPSFLYLLFDYNDGKIQFI
jgi:hypothetical protein